MGTGGYNRPGLSGGFRVRYAILFSGMSFRRHVNGLEFCYRTLTDRLRFAVENIQVLNYDGSLRAVGDTDDAQCESWPGDGTPHRMVVSAAGSRAAFQHALRALSEKLTPRDRLFINITGHGGHHGNGRGPDLITFPYCTRYKRDEFCEDLAVLPPHLSLVVLMAQCFSGGFNKAVVDASPAASTFIASATSETRQSFMSFEDGNWDSFQRNWIAALAGHDVDGVPLEVNPARADGGPVTVREAFAYASTCPGTNPYDSPEFAMSADSAGDLTLAVADR
jgi:Peptidase C13 family